MQLYHAIELVTNDERESYPDMTWADAIEHARNTIHPDNPGMTYDGTSGALPFAENGGVLTEAYRMVLSADLADLISAIAHLEMAADIAQR